MKKYKNTTQDTQKETALDLAKRGVLVINSAARDKILTRQVGLLPAAFMSVADHLTGNAITRDFFKATPRLSSKREQDDMPLLYFGAQVTERLRHIIPNCHPEPHPHF